MKECDKYVFSERRLLPNQLGELQLCSKLSVDKQLPKELKDIYNMLYSTEKIFLFAAPYFLGAFAPYFERL